MQRYLLLLVLTVLLALPALADAGGSPGGGREGTLEINHARGRIDLKIRGSAIGYVQRGLVIVVTKRKERGGGIETYSGKRIRFRELDGAYRIEIAGVGIDLSAVGRGTVLMRAGRRPGKTGTFSLNGGDPRPFPRRPTTLQLAGP